MPEKELEATFSQCCMTSNNRARSLVRNVSVSSLSGSDISFTYTSDFSTRSQLGDADGGGGSGGEEDDQIDSSFFSFGLDEDEEGSRRTRRRGTEEAISEGVSAFSSPIPLLQSSSVYSTSNAMLTSDEISKKAEGGNETLLSNACSTAALPLQPSEVKFRVLVIENSTVQRKLVMRRLKSFIDEEDEEVPRIVDHASTAEEALCAHSSHPHPALQISP